MERKEKQPNNAIWKMNPDELQDYLHFKSRGGSERPKKGKGSYTRKEKHKGTQEYT